ncbi:MAG TPA: zf-HC2 domain-containing protein [Candidatus Acidoferrales bacterium]
MKSCEDISKGLIGYLDQQANPLERRDVEQHLAGCAACRTRAEEFRALWKVMEEVPAVEPSFGFDARIRQHVAAEPSHSWFGWLAPQARFVLSAAMLVALTVWVAKLPQSNPVNPSPVAVSPSTDQDFDAIKDLGVLENYDVLTKFDALSESTTTSAPQPDQAQPTEPSSND